MTCDDKQHEQMNVFARIVNEILRQESVHPTDHIGHDRWGNADRLAILTAEVGEVASEVTGGLAGDVKIWAVDSAREHLVEELVQVAACAVAWISALEHPYYAHRSGG